ncbi:MAG: LysM peptidoglycan-binding domain-containing protein [Candidatus Merdisoma sp.]|jgi:nucleoid-associated protein YgaU
MIEFVYKEKAKEEGPELRLDLPKNVQQIGEPEENRKIYIEDYVITYLKRFAKEEALSSRMAILLGNSERMGGIPYLFIKSAIALKELEYSDGGIPFTDEVWAEVYSTIKEYFPAQDILGWFLSVPGYPMELDPGLLKIHVNYFGGVDKVLMVEEPTDGDEDFFAYEQGKLTRQRGYYIFYEQNEAMQRFMIDTGDGESIDEKEQFEDRAIKSFRAIVQEKKELSGQKRVMTFLYTASTFLVMVVLVIGITLINNYEKMEGLEMALSDISRTLESQDTPAAAEAVDSAETAAQQNGEASDAAAEAGAPEEDETGGAQSGEEQSGEAAGAQTAPEETEDEAAAEGTEEDAADQASEEAVQEEAAQEASAESVVPETYVVQAGDTLLGISRKIYGRDDQIDAICSLNGIDDSDHILVGQKLLLP